MKLRLMHIPIVLWLFGLLPAMAVAQHSHSDIELGYDNLLSPSRIEMEAGEITVEGIRLYEGAFVELDPFNPGDFGADDPGFATNAFEGLLMNANDRLWLQALNASSFSSFGVGYVNYYNPGTGMLEAAHRIAILDNTGATANLFLNGGFIESGANPQFIQTADGDGDIHDHVIFDLLDDGTAPLGAYGILFRLQADFSPGNGTMDVNSDPFWIVLNRGMSEEDFETLALPAFGLFAIPEPGAGVLLAGLALAATVRRRKRLS